MRERVRLDWRVPAAEWARFREYVRDEYGTLDGHLGREAEDAMRAYADADGLDGVEDKINRLVRAAGRTPEQRDEEKNNSYRADAETTRVTARVDELIKDEFRAVVDEKDSPYGRELARALDTHRNGGRASRLERKLDRVVDDAEAFLEQTAGESSETKMGKHKRCVIAICDHLTGDGPEFVDDELEAAIRDIAGVHSKPSIQSYREDVIQRLGVEPHPNVSHLWIPAERAAEYDSSPKECRQPVEYLDSADRVTRIQLAIGRRAACRDDGRISVPADEIRESVLCNETSSATTLELMRSAAQVVGISVRDDVSPTKLRVNLATLQEADPDLTRRIIDYRDETRSGLLEQTTETEMSDFIESPADEPAATAAATDGGEDR